MNSSASFVLDGQDDNWHSPTSALSFLAHTSWVINIDCIRKRQLSKKNIILLFLS